MSSKHYKFLYDLLTERKPFENISHKKLPSYNNHVKFIKSKPYAKWLLIECREKILGSVYLSKNNEIAIWIKKDIKDYKMKIRKKVLEEIITKFTRKKYLINLNPRNKKIINFYKKNGFKLIHSTFQLEGKKDENLKLHDKRKIEFYKKNGYMIAQHVYMFEKNSK
jgi:GNAT superfamily N-acetyltransferase